MSKSGQTDSLCGEGPALHQFPFTSRGHPLGMSRLIRPVLLAALLITSIHLRRGFNVFFKCSQGARSARSASASSPLKGVLALGPEEVDVGLELQLEDVVLVDAVRLLRRADGVAQQGETGEREVVLHAHT